MDDTSSSSPRFPTPRRVATTPISLPESTLPIPPLSEALVETLYTHPNVKIISFTATGRALWRSSGLRGDDAPGTLSWSSQLERTIAFGPFRIYRAPGSVAFLNCGSALQPILPRSQCWCIDEINSKFVLQIRRPNYWRIELPVANPEDQQRAEALREVFDKILRFEKTECPFKRSFTVELPEQPQTAVKKKPWTPVLRHVSPTMEAVDPPSPVSDPQEASLASRPTTPTPIRAKDRLDIPDTLLASHPEASAQHTHPSVRAEAAKLEAKIEAGIVERLESSYSNSIALSSYDQQLPASESIVQTQHLQGQEEFQPQCDVMSSRHSNIESRRHSDFSLPSILHDEMDVQHSVPRPMLNSPKTPSNLYSSRGFCAESSSNPFSDHQASRMTAEMPELQDEGSSSEDCLVASPITASPPPDGSPEDDPLLYELHEGTGFKKDQMKTRLRRTARFAIPRSATLPPHLKLSMDRSSDSSRITAPAPEPNFSRTLPPRNQDQTQIDVFMESKEHNLQRRGSEDSFHSVQSWHSDLPSRSQSPPILQSDTDATGLVQTAISANADANNKSPQSDTALDSSSNLEMESDEEGETLHDESTATASYDSSIKMVGAYPTGTSPESVEKKPTTALRRRAMTNHRPTTSITVGRALSPLPPPANLFTPIPSVEQRPFHSKLKSFRNLPMAIIIKTCEMILGPPSHLIALMLKVAAKIIAGEWRGLVFGYSEDGEQIPVQWDYSEGEFSDWSDDEPYMGSHPDRTGAPAMGDEDTTSDGTDDSRTWGVD